MSIYEESSNETSQSFFAFTAVFFVIGLITSNAAFQFISYPIQVVGKGLLKLISISTFDQRLQLFIVSALKPIPIMIFGFWVGGKSYAIHKYFLVLLIVSGAIMFLYKPIHEESNGKSYNGYILVGISLLMNGCTAGVQEKMRSIARPSPLNLMLYLNSWSSVFLVVGVAVSGEVNEFIQYCSTHQEVLIHLGLILVVGVCGQYFTCTMITHYGVVPCCLVLTVRKFFNVLFSVLYFSNVLNIRQWLAIALIFTSLVADSVLSFKFSKCDKDVHKIEFDENAEKIKEDKNFIMSVKNTSEMNV